MSGTQDSPGIIPYALDEVFDFISNSTNREFLLRVSYMEIYNEIITDLLNPKSTNLKIRENVQGEISVDKLTEKVVTSVQDIIILMKVGEKNRHVGNTNLNEKSSRSHTIFRMVSLIKPIYPTCIYITNLLIFSWDLFLLVSFRLQKVEKHLLGIVVITAILTAQ